MTRHEVREQAFILIFESLFRDDTPDEIIEVAKENEEFLINDDVISMFKGTIEKFPEIKEKISKYSEKRQYERIPKVNIAILSLAMYEVMYTEMPMNAAISEAVIIAKNYTYDSDVSFINGILGAFSRDPENNK
ncbi:MAG: transcription antitermination factor NusB [Oscillospiraceae bacterium]|nr:transcription antitermination factor NusB [Oscillospiraceae bacterium]MBR4093381.1 transcription antitermination factor NusB [Oscillospiraceae bacterium]